MERATGTNTSEIEQRLIDALAPFVGTLIARSILDWVRSDTGKDLASLHASDRGLFRDQLQKGLKVFITDPGRVEDCLERLDDQLFQSSPVASERQAGSESVCVKITGEYDIVAVRGKAREVCEEIGFSMSVQIKVATVVSELARNIVQYARSGEILLNKIKRPREGIEVVAMDEGPGIGQLDTILSGEHKSQMGMGMGILGTKNLMDDFDVQTEAGGTRVTARKYLT